MGTRVFIQPLGKKLYTLGRGAINDSPARIEVYPETVGQYTGLKDNNEKKDI